LFNRSHGSILLSAFFHFQLINPIYPDAQPYDTYLLIVAAALIVWWNRKDMFTKEGSVTEIIPSQMKVTDGYRDREEPHDSPLPHHAAYGSVCEEKQKWRQ